MTMMDRIIAGLSYCFIAGLIIFGGGGPENGTLLAAESSLMLRGEQASRFRVEDEEDLHWKIMTFGAGAASGHSIGHSAYGAIDHQVHDRGVEYGDQGRYNQAIVEFTKCLQGNPRYARAYYNRGTAYARSGQPDLAIADFTKFIEIYPSPVVSVFHNRGVVYTRKGQYDLALADFNQVLNINSQSDADTDMVGGGRRRNARPAPD